MFGCPGFCYLKVPTNSAVSGSVVFAVTKTFLKLYLRKATLTAQINLKRYHRKMAGGSVRRLFAQRGFTRC